MSGYEELLLRLCVFFYELFFVEMTLLITTSVGSIGDSDLSTLIYTLPDLSLINDSCPLSVGMRAEAGD